ncbi:MAG: DEAD/DEAH box helicase [Actinomycetota bacterium]|nr:DEAD/DEAH box helicase [Actinomycetota bacterium]
MSRSETSVPARSARRLDSSHLRRFADGYDFPFDDFQRQALLAVQDGRSSVLVAAPTGSGKTLVGEFAAYLALQTGTKTFYTTPIKALSNQKYADFVARYGADKVGLLTGDASINGEAPVVVMTTEVLRNMIYAGSATLDGLGYVVMDEVHYLADRFRGAVWEEVIIQLPEQVQLISLSATVSNAEEFGEWLGQVRGDTELIVEETRPVPLWQHMMVGPAVFDLFVDDERDSERLRLNPQLLQRIQGFDAKTDRHGRREDAGGPRGRRGKARNGRSSDGPVRAGRPGRGPSRAEVIDALDRKGLLPAITFIFSRVGCESAVTQLLAWGTRLIPVAEGERIRDLVQQRVAYLPEEDLAVLGYWDFVEGLGRGFAAHHAGMLPTFREIVEELFTEGRIKAVFATETLALGINMPARTVVLEKLVKYNGETHADITPGEFTQLTGRAGRRGIDYEGHAVVLYHRGLDPHHVGGLASTRTYPLRSSFVPTSNMAVNLVERLGRPAARDLLQQSFAQFQADKSVVGVASAIRHNEEGLEGYLEAMQCHLGDFAQYAALRRELSDLQKDAARSRNAGRRAAIATSLEGLVAGDVVQVPIGRRTGRAVVISSGGGRRGTADPVVLTQDGEARRLEIGDLQAPLLPFAKLTIPKGFHSRNPKARRDLAVALRVQTSEESADRATDPGNESDDQSATTEAVEQLRRRLRDHPCAQCEQREDHARWAERWWRLRRETDSLSRKVSGRTQTVAATFDRICDLLTELGYLSEDGQHVTADGQVLKRIYAEKDLLVAQCLREGVWSRLDAASLVAVVSALVHQARREGEGGGAKMPNTQVSEALEDMHRLWGELHDQQAGKRLQPTGEPDAGIAAMMHRWASGARLDAVLRDAEMSAGDFVRRCKQLVDLLDQIHDASGDPAIRKTTKAGINAVMRGVVAADRLD